MKGLSYPFCTVFPVDGLSVHTVPVALQWLVVSLPPTTRKFLVQDRAGPKKEKSKTFLYEPFAISSLTTGGNNSKERRRWLCGQLLITIGVTWCKTLNSEKTSRPTQTIGLSLPQSTYFPRCQRTISLVAGAGLEPATFGLWARRATNCYHPAMIIYLTTKNRTKLCNLLKVIVLLFPGIQCLQPSYHPRILQKRNLGYEEVYHQ